MKNVVDLQMLCKDGDNEPTLQIRQNIVYDEHQERFVALHNAKWIDVGKILEVGPKVAAKQSRNEENRILRAIISEFVELEEGRQAAPKKDTLGRKAYYLKIDNLVARAKIALSMGA